MQLFTDDLRRATDAERSPPTVAPLDIGVDAVSIARRVLARARSCPATHLCFESQQTRWFWEGSLGQSAWRGGVCLLMGGHALAEIDPTDVFAVSIIGDGTTVGVRLFDITGGWIALWTTDLDGFKTWLADISPDQGWRVSPVRH